MKEHSSYEAGIYSITHKPTGHVYIGQANCIRRRWANHKRDLTNGTHHNRALQRLWTDGSPLLFEFSVLETAPPNLSPLSLQRWLFRREREIYHEHVESETLLNTAHPEIVDTKASSEEFLREQASGQPVHDVDEIASRQRRTKIAELRETLKQIDEEILELIDEKCEVMHLILAAPWYKRLLGLVPPGYDHKAATLEYARLGRALDEKKRLRNQARDTRWQLMQGDDPSDL